MSKFLSVILLVPFFTLTQDDCVFNNDYEGLTTDWIERANTTYKFTWIEEENIAIARLSDDESLQLQMGGCYHFTTSLIFRTTNAVELDNEKFWLSKALELTKLFEVKFFKEPLEAGVVVESERTNNMIIYTFPIDEFGNRITEGIIIERKEKATTLTLSYYFN